MEGKKNFLDDISREKPESFRKEVFIPAQKKPGRMIATAVIILVIIVVAYFLLQLRNVTVPNMSQWQLAEVQTWASKYHDNTLLNGVYSKESELNSIISQDAEPGKRITSNSSLTITYSLGADPEELITIPDLKNLALTDINTWIDENQLSGITLQYETSDIIAKDCVIDYEYVDGSAEEFLRKNRMIIYVSSGGEDLDATIEMQDLYGKTKAEVMQWAEESQVKVTISEEFNPYVDYGKVFGQSISAVTKMTRNDLVTVNISRGKQIQVPDFTGMSRTEASDLATLNGISIFYKMVISDEEPDSVLSQDTPAGTDIDGQQIVTLQIAKQDGKILVPDFIGLTANEVNDLAGLYGIKVFIKNKDELGSNGIVASQSIASGKEIDNDKLVTLKLKENTESITVPNFIGLSKNEAVVLAQNQGIAVSFNEVDTRKAKNLTITNQNVKAKNRIGADETILLDVAVNSGIKAENIWNMDLNEAKAWAAQKGITLNVIDYYNSDYTVGSIYYQDCETDDFIPSNKILTVYHSLGLVMLDNFIGKNKTDIIKWRDEVNSKGAAIKLTFIDDVNTTKTKGIITVQSISGDLVLLNQTIQVWVSTTDQGVLIKDFNSVQLEDFKFWCDTNEVPYIVTDCYTDTIEKGKLFGQNYTDTYLPKGEYLKIFNSLGKVYIKDFTNQTKSSMIDWQMDINSKRANIIITFIGEYSNIVDMGKIIDQSVNDKELDTNGTLIVRYSLGKI